MALYPPPHSEEWFDALSRFNPTQAAHTRRIVALAGRDDICGVCGDDPADDYQIVMATIPAHAVATLRLCEDCHQIRSNNGERFERS